MTDDRSDERARMRSKKRLALRTVLAIAVLIAVFVFATHFSRRDELVYGGKPLTKWLIDLQSDNEEEREAAKAVLLKAGTNVLPHLAELAAATDSPLRRKLARLLARQPFDQLAIATESDLRFLAVGAFGALGRDAEPAIPALANLLTNPPTARDAAQCLAVVGPASGPVLLAGLTNRDRNVRAYSAFGLGLIRPRQTSAVPPLVDVLNDKEQLVRLFAIRALGEIAYEPSLTIPALVQCLQDGNATVRVRALQAIGAFGTNALFAIHQVKQMQEDSDPIVRSAADDVMVRMQVNKIR